MVETKKSLKLMKKSDFIVATIHFKCVISKLSEAELMSSVYIPSYKWDNSDGFSDVNL